MTFKVFFPLLFASLVAVTMFIFDKLDEKRRSILSYSFFFLLTLIFTSLLFWTASLSSLESNKFHYPKKIITKADYQKQFEYHKSEGKKAYQEAEEICMWIPNLKDREEALVLFRECVAASICTGFFGWRGLVSQLIMSLADYGVFVYKQGRKAKELLEKASHHYDMMIYYSTKMQES